MDRKIIINFFEDVINLIFDNWIYLLVIPSVLLCLLIIVMLVCSYYVLKILKVKFEKNYFSIKDYNKNCKIILKKYGKYKIKNIYLVKRKITDMTSNILNMITFNKFDKGIRKLENKYVEKYVPMHTSLILELKTKNGEIKNILVEKTNSVTFCLNYKQYDDSIIKKIKLQKKIKFESLMNLTLERMGVNKFFNYSIFKNNCQIWIKEILKTVNKDTKKNLNFIYQRDLVKSNFSFYDCSLYMIYGIINGANILESILGMQLF